MIAGRYNYISKSKKICLEEGDHFTKCETPDQDKSPKSSILPLKHTCSTNSLSYPEILSITSL